MSTKERDLILLATDLQSSSVGLTKQQLKERVEARTGTIPSTRTLDRWLASLSVLGMEIDYTLSEQEHWNTKVYKLKSLPSGLLHLDEDERSSLERYLANPNVDTNTDKIVRQAISKVLATQDEPLSKTILHKTQELIEQTGYSGNIQPRITIDETQIAIIEKAIQLQQKITFKYKTQTSKRATQTTTLPLGLLFGRFGYLVCLGMSEKPIIYRLDLLQDV